MHIRTAIRENVKAALTGIEAVDGRVFSSRISAFEDHELPAIIVSTPTDTVSLLNTSPVRPRVQRRDQTIDVVIVASATDSLDDDLDELAEQVEAKMQVDPTLGVQATNLELRGNQSTVIGDGSEMRGVLKLNYSVTVSTREGAPKSIHAQ